MIPFILKKILKKSLIYNYYLKIVKFFQWRAPDLWEFDILFAYTNYKKNVHFIQIGSNNGINGDPIYNYIVDKGWNGILIEPIPYLFNELKANYFGSHNRLYFENSAIAAESGKLAFYRLKQSNLPNLPVWYDQLGSFNKKVVEKHREQIPHFDSLFIEDTVNAITFNQLLQKYAITKLNLIHIDTEGYDYEIIKMLPLNKLEIDFIMFEHKHLSDEDYKNAVMLLRSYGYRIGKKDLSDTIAIKRKIMRVLKKQKRL